MPAGIRAQYLAEMIAEAHSTQTPLTALPPFEFIVVPVMNPDGYEVNPERTPCWARWLNLFHLPHSADDPTRCAVHVHSERGGLPECRRLARWHLRQNVAQEPRSNGIAQPLRSCCPPCCTANLLPMPLAACPEPHAFLALWQGSPRGCVGIDLNRNWPVDFGERGGQSTSTDRCEEIYTGERYFEAEEVPGCRMLCTPSRPYCTDSSCGCSLCSCAPCLRTHADAGAV